MNPLFDLLVRVVGTNLPQARLLLHRVRLFDFPYRAHEVLPTVEITPEQRVFWQEHFCLPFDAVAIEDTGSVVAIFDSLPDQQGLAGKRYFLEGLPVHASPDEYNPDEAERRVQGDAFAKNSPVDSMSVTMGWIDNVQMQDDGGMVFDGKLDLAILATPQRVFMDVMRQKQETQKFKVSTDLAKRQRGVQREQQEIAFEHGTLLNVTVALKEIMSFNTPNRFVVERTPRSYLLYAQRQQAKKRRKQDRTKRRVLSSTERPTYILLKPDEIREQFHFPTPTGTTKTAHERRRHLRTYPDDPKKYPNAHGRTVAIPATWVGPSEHKTKDTRYRVLLDL